ncbi:Ig-like domain-containing protein [Rhodococcus sp. UNC363MFTsu5.1]|uniref:Ig-like domain-containing protein n=1 Tax=Rhodococcus sp. UNC363MFTsu5.1 TaxID=1449069 RepID=UPI00068B17BE|nr:Ig-like domain-containing protein [Rhodococcus sp. UNC363MFTsu5.1]
MTSGHIARGVAAGAATTLALGALAFLGAGTAVAAPGSIAWDDGSSHFTRTVSNTTPNAGETITVTTKFERTSWVDEFIYNVKDRHPSCLTYVPGSAKMIGENEYPVLDPEVQVDEGNGTGYVRASWGITDWVVQNRPGFHRSPTFSVRYKVGTDCARGTALNTGMDYGGSLGSGNYGTKGPSVTVGANTVSTTTVNPVTGATVGKATTLTAKVDPAAAGGTVKFKDGDSTIGTAPVGADGTATLQWTPNTAGERAITAEYSGNGAVNASTGFAAVTVAPGDGGGDGGTGSLDTGSLGSLLGGFGS